MENKIIHLNLTHTSTKTDIHGILRGPPLMPPSPPENKALLRTILD